MLNILTVLSLLHLSTAQIGPGGIDCTPDQGDSPDVCTTTSAPWDTVTKSGKIECEENFDCCLCETITCKSCEEFNANGDSSAIGVQSITINGKSDGATIDCNGDSSCESTVFIATNVKDVKCSGDLSCKLSAMDIGFVADDGGKLECNGDESCFGADISATNVLELKCGGDESCFESSIDVECDSQDNDPCKIECDGDAACFSATISASNVESLGCGGESSCQSATIGVLNPDEDFKLECGDAGCQEIDLTITINNNIDKLEEISCGSPSGCTDASITLTSNTGNVELETLDCDGFRACENAKFTLSGVTISECKCSNEYGCYNITGVPECEDESTTLQNPAGFDCVWYEENTDSGDFLCDVGGSTTTITDNQIECDDPSSCCLCQSIVCSPNCDEFKATDDFAARGVQDITINGNSGSPASINCDGYNACADTVLTGTDVKEIKCSGLQSCAFSAWTLTCSEDDLCSVECDGDSACQASTISGSNVKELKCNGDRACYGGTFNLNCTEDEPCEIQCEGDEACKDVTITADFVKELKCEGDNACSGAQIVVSSAVDEFGIECSEGGCAGVSVQVTTMGNDLKEIKCDENACANAKFAFINNGASDVSIDKIACDGEDACLNALFTFSGTTNAIVVDECECGDEGEDYGCDGVIGLNDVNCQQGGVDDAPSLSPTQAPTGDPTTSSPTPPTQNPTTDPTAKPTLAPTKFPTDEPTKRPTRDPTKEPTKEPTKDPTEIPTQDPTKRPTQEPTKDPTEIPTQDPTTSEPTPTPSNFLAAAAEALNGVLHDAGDDAVVTSDLDVETLQISLSPTALANLWGMAALCIVGNLVAYFCFCRGSKKSVSFGQNGGQDQYISDQ